MRTIVQLELSINRARDVVLFIRQHDGGEIAFKSAIQFATQYHQQIEAQINADAVQKSDTDEVTHIDVLVEITAIKWWNGYTQELIDLVDAHGDTWNWPPLEVTIIDDVELGVTEDATQDNDSDSEKAEQPAEE